MAIDPAELNPTAIVNKVPLPQGKVLAEGQKVDPEADLAFVRNFRVMMLNALATNGLPADVKEQAMLLQIVKDMDSSALSSIRIKVESETSDKDEQMRVLAAEIMNRILTRPAAPVIDVSATEVRKREIPTLPDDIVTRPFVAGESDQGTIHQTFEQFQAKTGGEITLTGEDTEI